MNLKEKIKSQFSYNWWAILETELSKEYLVENHKFLQTEANLGHTLYPVAEDLYKPFKVDYDDVLVVLVLPVPIISYVKSKSFREISDFIEKDCYKGLNLHLELSLDYLTKEGIMILPTSLSCGSCEQPHKMWDPLAKATIKALDNCLNTRMFIYHEDCSSYMEQITNPRHIKVKLEDNAFKKADTFLKEEYNMTIKW